MSHRSHGRTREWVQETYGDEAGVHYVTSETPDVHDDETSDRIRETCRAFDTVVEPLDAERTTSRMHGRMWELRRQATTRHQPDWSFGLGAPFARQVARVGGPGAKGLLFSLGHQAPPRLRQLCFGLAFDLPVLMPRWATDLAHATLTRSAATSWEEPEQLVVLEFARRSHQPFTVAVLINDARGGIARHYGLMAPLDQLVERGDPDGAFALAGQPFHPCPPGEACRRVQTAIVRSDATDERLVDLESTKSLRALTLSRIEPHLTVSGSP